MNVIILNKILKFCSFWFKKKNQQTCFFFYWGTHDTYISDTMALKTCLPQKHPVLREVLCFFHSNANANKNKTFGSAILLFTIISFLGKYLISVHTSDYHD